MNWKVKSRFFKISIFKKQNYKLLLNNYCSETNQPSRSFDVDKKELAQQRINE